MLSIPALGMWFPFYPLPWATASPQVAVKRVLLFSNAPIPFKRRTPFIFLLCCCPQASCSEIFSSWLPIGHPKTSKFNIMIALAFPVLLARTCAGSCHVCPADNFPIVWPRFVILRLGVSNTSLDSLLRRVGFLRLFNPAGLPLLLGCTFRVNLSHIL